LFFRVMALGWRGTPQQWHSLEAGIRAMAVIIIPVAVSVHTIVSWDFAMAVQPMWHSTIFGPYFVVGAIYSGVAVLMVAMYLLRRGLGIGEYLSDKVFNNLGLLFLAFALMWGYFTFAEHLTVWYGHEHAEMTVFNQRISGEYAWVFWTMIVTNVVIPLSVLPFPKGRSPLGTAIVGLGVLVGMWIERFLIVVGTLRYPRVGRGGHPGRLHRAVRLPVLRVRADHADRFDLGGPRGAPPGGQSPNAAPGRREGEASCLRDGRTRPSRRPTTFGTL
jgi:molybdopterin-containing oxidoreductase family membrane subunit